MKRTITLIALLMALVILLSACKEKTEDPGTTGGTTTVPTQEITITTEPETIPPTETKEKTPAELSTAEDFQEFINRNQWYWRAIGCVFEKPEDIAAYYYFYLGVGETSQQFTEEERAFLKDAYEKTHPKGGYEVMSDIKLPVAKINDALSILGVTIEDIKIPDQWVYYDKTDSYYFWVSDAYGVDRWSVTKVEKGTEGIVAIYWETEIIALKPGEILKDAKMVLTMQLMQDGTYRVLSNVPQV